MFIGAVRLKNVFHPERLVKFYDIASFNCRKRQGVKGRRRRRKARYERDKVRLERDIERKGKGEDERKGRKNIVDKNHQL